MEGGGWKAEGGRRRGAKSEEVFSRLEGGGWRAEADEKGSKNFPLGTPLNYFLSRFFQIRGGTK